MRPGAGPAGTGTPVFRKGVPVQALTFAGIGRVVYERVADPQLQDAGDAIVRVLRTAVCGSDLYAYHGREVGLDPGTVLGHEFLGEAVEVGESVRGLRRGDTVVSPFSTACGACPACVEGLSARCSSGQLFGWVAGGVGLQGAQAEFVRVPLAGTTLVPVPSGVSLDVALLMGDVLATGLYCALRAGIDPRGAYAVLGCGPVGLAAILGARALGAERIFALDSVPERLTLAARFGATALRVHDGVAAELRAALAGRGVDAVLEAVGTEAASRLALDLVRPGGTISAVGVHTEASFAFTPNQAYDKNLTYRIGRCPARSLMPGLIDWVRTHQVEVEALITHRLPLSAGAEAYRTFDTKHDGCIKVVLTPGA